MTNSMYFDVFLEAAKKADCVVLDSDHVIVPPDRDFGYDSTPRNALTFASMGVDGVHNAILLLQGAVSDDSPVVQVCPMDSDDVCVLAPSFLLYLADGCAVSTETMSRVLDSECRAGATLVPFLFKHFRHSRLLVEERLYDLNRRFCHLIERKQLTIPSVPVNLVGQVKVLAGALGNAVSKGGTPESLQNCTDSLNRILELAREFEGAVEGELHPCLRFSTSCEPFHVRLQQILTIGHASDRVRQLNRMYLFVEARINHVEMVALGR